MRISGGREVTSESDQCIKPVDFRRLDLTKRWKFSKRTPFSVSPDTSRLEAPSISISGAQDGARALTLLRMQTIQVKAFNPEDDAVVAEQFARSETNAPPTAARTC